MTTQKMRRCVFSCFVHGSGGVGVWTRVMYVVVHSECEPLFQFFFALLLLVHCHRILLSLSLFPSVSLSLCLSLTSIACARRTCYGAPSLDKLLFATT